MSAASASVLGSSWSACTTWLTSPHASACSALRKLPVSDSSLARASPIRRESFCDRPQPGMTPTRACVSAKRACGEATIRSQARASSKPPVIAGPLMAPMMGPVNAFIAPSTSTSPVSPIVAGWAPSSFRSSPAQKARPAPVRTTTRALGSCASARNADVRCTRSARDSAFIACGRFRVRTTVPSKGRSISSSADSGMSGLELAE